MGLTCAIKIKKNRIFNSGDKITGEIKYILDKPTNIEFILVSLTGVGRTSWAIMKREDNGTLYSSSEEYINLHEMIQETEQFVETGVYKAPFEFDIPNHIPSSYSGKKCQITYRIEVKFSKVHRIFTLMDDTKLFSRIVTIRGSVQPFYPQPLTLQMTKMPFLKEPVNVNIDVQETFVKPGEDIRLVYKVDNDASVPVRGFQAKLVTRIVYKMRNSKVKTVKNKANKQNVGAAMISKKNPESEIAFTVPTSSTMQTIQHSEIMERHYVLSVTAKFPFPYKNMTVGFPIVIGEKCVMKDEDTGERKGTSFEYQIGEKKRNHK